MPHSCARFPSPFLTLGQQSSRMPRLLLRAPRAPLGLCFPGMARGYPGSWPRVAASGAHHRAVRKRRMISASPDAGRSAPNTLQRPVGRMAPFRPACSREEQPGWVAFSLLRSTSCALPWWEKPFSSFSTPSSARNIMWVF